MFPFTDEPEGRQPHAILLYVLVIADRGYQVPIFSMVTERQDANIIMFWLMEWRRQGGTVPREFTTDMSLALLNAAARALANFPSLESYIETLFKIASSATFVRSDLPDIFIRIDIAHLMKNVADSDAFHDVRPKVKEFFIRCVAELIKETDFMNAKRHIHDVLLVALSRTEGNLECDGQATPCELAKKGIERKIMGVPMEEYGEYNKKDDNYGRTISEQTDLLDCLEDSSHLLTLNEWMNEIKQQVEITVRETDAGDRDNLMYNPKFAKHFLRLCKLLPLWCGISCPLFETPSVTSSSANVESYFNDVKRTMKEIIPCKADIFVQNHIDGINDAVITASQKYARTVETIASKPVAETERDKAANAVTSSILNDDDLEQYCRENYDASTESVPDKPSESAASIQSDKDSVIKCIACKDGNFPTNAHTCIECGKNVHVLDGCSVSIGSDEGYGSQRICSDCHSNKRTQARDANEMRYEEQWARKNTKQSSYMKPNPLFNLMSETKKQRIGLLKNAHLYKRPVYINKKPIQLANTCAPDALAQAIAGAYAYNPAMRAHYEKQSDALVQIAISLAKK